MAREKTVESYMSIKDVARELSVDPFSVRRWVWLRELRAVKVGQRWQVSPSAVKDFIVQRTKKGLKKI